MKEYVAVNDSMVLFNLNALKRQALMFDRIAVPFFSRISEQFMERSRVPLIITEVEWLMGQGIAFEPELDFDKEKLAANDEFRSFVGANLSELEPLFKNSVSSTPLTWTTCGLWSEALMDGP